MARLAETAAAVRRRDASNDLHALKVFVIGMQHDCQVLLDAIVAEQVAAEAGEHVAKAVCG